ncbi:hypothetical protein BSTAB16_7052 [Burkholderia stabilis]|uniref:Uncharacterized protein n=1 Tax=Burkholderia stabilis TaxID=95485 RepID=A0AAJ5NE74_9BURK|nr:hypothetical protein BSTAB16_7052 [Burkholderia stabilis]
MTGSLARRQAGRMRVAGVLPGRADSFSRRNAMGMNISEPVSACFGESRSRADGGAIAVVVYRRLLRLFDRADTDGHGQCDAINRELFGRFVCTLWPFAIARRVSRSCFIGIDTSHATNGQVRRRLRMGADSQAWAVHSATQRRGPGSAGSLAVRRAGGRDRHPMQSRSYERPRNATKITPAIASRPPNTVSMPGRSPVSAIDNAVATAGVR